MGVKSSHSCSTLLTMTSFWTPQWFLKASQVAHDHRGQIMVQLTLTSCNLPKGWSSRIYLKHTQSSASSALFGVGRVFMLLWYIGINLHLGGSQRAFWLWWDFWKTMAYCFTVDTSPGHKSNISRISSTRTKGFCLLSSWWPAELASQSQQGRWTV